MRGTKRLGGTWAAETSGTSAIFTDGTFFVLYQKNVVTL
jgi:hypothetical protein